MELRCAVASDEDGFTLVEVLVAMVLLMGGILGVVQMIDTANKATAVNDGRDGAVSLARRVVEVARQIPYPSLTTGAAPAAIQAAAPDLVTSGGGWSVARGPYNYSIALSACSVDNPADGLGSHPGSVAWCPGGSAAGTTDQQPEDYKWLSVTLTWTQYGASKTVKQSTAVIPGGG